MPGVLEIHDPFTGASYHDGVVPPTQRWLYTDGPSTSTGQQLETVQHFTFKPRPMRRPIGRPEGRGRAGGP